MCLRVSTSTRVDVEWGPVSTQRQEVDSTATVPVGGLAPGVGPDRSRRLSRRAAVVAAAAAVVALAVGGPAVLKALRPAPPPADSPSEALHLPTVVNAPGTWSDDEGPDGPLAALGIAMRTRPEGLTGERQQLQLFGVSAVDGRSAWVDLPGVHEEDEALVGWFALSPDGRWIGWARHEDDARSGMTGPLRGWAVMDTTTGKVRNLADPTSSRLRETASDLAFSGDSRYLLTSYEKSRAPRKSGHQFVAWDVQDGTATVLEEPGHYWLPNLGSAPTGVVWARGTTVFREDPGTGAASTYSLPRSVVTASWAPDDTAFAYIGWPARQFRGPWRLYAGRTPAEARDRALRLPNQPGQLLGWSDSRHVVVGYYRTTAQVVDVLTGAVVKIPMAGQGTNFNAPLLAADLWQNELAPPADPAGTRDPRRPWRWGGGALLLLLAGAFAVRRRRTRA
jgi:hypothetical protein